MNLLKTFILVQKHRESREKTNIIMIPTVSLTFEEAFWIFHSILSEGQSPSLLFSNSNNGISPEKLHLLNLLWPFLSCFYY